MTKLIVMGVGGAGCEIAYRFQADPIFTIFALNTDCDALNECALQKKILLGPSICKGAPAETPAVGRRAAEESRAVLEAALNGVKRLILLAGLGGGTGTGAMAVIVNIAHQLGVEVLVAVSLPFLFENAQRSYADACLGELAGMGADVFIFDHAENLPSANASFLQIIENNNMLMTKNIIDYLKGKKWIVS